MTEDEFWGRKPAPLTPEDEDHARDCAGNAAVDGWLHSSLNKDRNAKEDRQ